MFILEQLKHYREIDIPLTELNCFLDVSQKCIVNILYVIYSVCKAIDRKINEDRKLIIYNKIICIQILTEVIVLFLDFSLLLIFKRKELEEIQNLCRQNIEDRTQQAELIKQLEALNADTQKVLQDQEYAYTAKTTYQKVCYSALCS